MRDEFGFGDIRAVEFCVNIRGNDGAASSYLIPTDRSVQDALRAVLDSTVDELEPEDGQWQAYELSEKHATKESIRAPLASEEMATMRALYAEEGWDISSHALDDPSRIVYYFGAFRDGQGRKLVGVRQATQFKGAVKGRFLSIIDDTLRMVTDRVFKLDSQFDFLITAQHVYILHPAGFERLADIEAFAAARARTVALALGQRVKFLDFTGIAAFVGTHKRAARLAVALGARQDLATINRTLFCNAAQATGVQLVKAGRKVAPANGNELGCLELLDHRRYNTTLIRGNKPAFVAASRRPV